MPLAKKNVLQTIGHALIFLGILVWAPYFYLKVIQQPVEVMNYLPFHLTGILGGITLLLINYFVSRRGEERA